MPIPFTDFEYIYPPRTNASAAITDQQVMNLWRGFGDAVGQFKADGKRTEIYVTPSRELYLWDRHKKRQDYQLTPVLREQVLAMSPWDKWTVWDLELMYYQTKFVKDVLYFYDVLVWESQHLIDINYKTRYGIVEKAVKAITDTPFMPLLPDATPEEQGAALGRNKIYLAENFPPETWEEKYALAVKHSHLEGLVLKNTLGRSRLEYGHKELNNAGWMNRIRKPDKNYTS